MDCCPAASAKPGASRPKLWPARPCDLLALGQLGAVLADPRLDVLDAPDLQLPGAPILVRVGKALSPRDRGGVLAGDAAEPGRDVSGRVEAPLESHIRNAMVF